MMVAIVCFHWKTDEKRTNFQRFSRTLKRTAPAVRFSVMDTFLDIVDIFVDILCILLSGNLSGWLSGYFKPFNPLFVLHVFACANKYLHVFALDFRLLPVFGLVISRLK